MTPVVLRAARDIKNHRCASRSVPRQLRSRPELDHSALNFILSRAVLPAHRRVQARTRGVSWSPQCFGASTQHRAVCMPGRRKNAPETTAQHGGGTMIRCSGNGRRSSKGSITKVASHPQARIFWLRLQTAPWSIQQPVRGRPCAAGMPGCGSSGQECSLFSGGVARRTRRPVGNFSAHGEEGSYPESMMVALARASGIASDARPLQPRGCCGHARATGPRR